MSQQETSRALDILSSISVIIPTYNRSSLLIETLERCRRYSEGMDIEFVVIDDGSKDETATALQALATTWPELTLAQREKQWTGPSPQPGSFAGDQRRSALHGR